MYLKQIKVLDCTIRADGQHATDANLNVRRYNTVRSHNNSLPSITDEHMTLEGCITIGNRKPLPSYQTSSPPKNQDKGFLTLLLMDLH